MGGSLSMIGLRCVGHLVRSLFLFLVVVGGRILFCRRLLLLMRLSILGFGLEWVLLVWGSWI